MQRPQMWPPVGALQPVGNAFQFQRGIVEKPAVIAVFGFAGTLAHPRRHGTGIHRLFGICRVHKDTTPHGRYSFRLRPEPCARMKRLLCLFLAFSAPAFAVDYVGTHGADPQAVARIHADIVDCPGCRLMGADLSNTCVKEHDLHGANFDGANATLMCMSFADFRGASFRGTELSGANLAGAKMDGADLTGAVTSITSFLGTDLRNVKGLTQKQLDIACSDRETRLPAGLKPHFCR